MVCSCAACSVVAEVHRQLYKQRLGSQQLRPLSRCLVRELIGNCETAEPPLWACLAAEHIISCAHATQVRNCPRPNPRTRANSGGLAYTSSALRWPSPVGQGLLLALLPAAQAHPPLMCACIAFIAPRASIGMISSLSNMHHALTLRCEACRCLCCGTCRQGVQRCIDGCAAAPAGCTLASALRSCAHGVHFNHPGAHLLLGRLPVALRAESEKGWIQQFALQVWGAAARAQRHAVVLPPGGRGPHAHTLPSGQHGQRRLTSSMNTAHCSPRAFNGVCKCTAVSHLRCTKGSREGLVRGWHLAAMLAPPTHRRRPHTRGARSDARHAAHRSCWPAATAGGGVSCTASSRQPLASRTVMHIDGSTIALAPLTAHVSVRREGVRVPL